MSRMGYDGIAVCVPVTVPYSRYSLRSAHWFCGRALADLIAGAGVAKADVDGFCISSFTLAPDSAVGLTQHLGHQRSLCHEAEVLHVVFKFSSTSCRPPESSW